MRSHKTRPAGNVSAPPAPHGGHRPGESRGSSPGIAGTPTGTRAKRKSVSLLVVALGLSSAGVSTAEGMPSGADLRSPSASPSATFRRVIGKDAHTVQTLVDVQTVAGRSTTTPEHPFFVRGKGWVNAANLNEGDTLETRSGAGARIVAVDIRRTAERFVFNIAVEKDHTYYIGHEGLLVHNGVCAALVADKPAPLGETDRRDLLRQLERMRPNEVPMARHERIELLIGRVHQAKEERALWLEKVNPVMYGTTKRVPEDKLLLDLAHARYGHQPPPPRDLVPSRNHQIEDYYNWLVTQRNTSLERIRQLRSRAAMERAKDKPYSGLEDDSVVAAVDRAEAYSALNEHLDYQHEAITTSKAMGVPDFLSGDQSLAREYSLQSRRIWTKSIVDDEHISTEEQNAQTVRNVLLPELRRMAPDTAERLGPSPPISNLVKEWQKAKEDRVDLEAAIKGVNETGKIRIARDKQGFPMFDERGRIMRESQMQLHGLPNTTLGHELLILLPDLQKPN